MGVNEQNFYQMQVPMNDLVKQATGRDEVQNIDTEFVSVGQMLRSVDDSDKTFICETEQQYTLKDFLTEFSIPLKYKYEWCFVKISGTTSTTTSLRAVNWLVFVTQDPSEGGHGEMFGYNYRTATIQPDEIPFFQSVSFGTGNSFDIVNKQIKANNSTSNSVIIAENAQVEALHLPFRWNPFGADRTLI